jgi:hypothetical protein
LGDLATKLHHVLYLLWERYVGRSHVNDISAAIVSDGASRESHRLSRHIGCSY